MVSFRSVAVLALAQCASASLERIAGYQPQSSVTDHNALDLDQQLIEKLLSDNTEQSFQDALDVYENGAFSKSVATVRLASQLTAPLAEDTELSGVTSDNDQVDGTLYKAAAAGDQEIQFQYQVSDRQSSYVNCQVGANPDPNTEGCLAASGTISVKGTAQSFTYTYTPTTDNKNERTIQKFSTEAKKKMLDCDRDNCPHVTFEKYNNYYGHPDYADKWIIAAFEGKSAGLSRGNADFSQYGNAGKAQAIKKGTAYMSIWMYVIREMEDALGDCEEGCATLGCNDDPVHAWDEAVAFYTGSLEGKTGAGDGVMPYALADKRCENFKTCGDLADEVTGTSHVNINIFREFDRGLAKLIGGECSATRENLEKIEQQMMIPLIQGTLRYAYFVSTGTSTTEKSKAEGATFAAAILPAIHSCDEDAAETIYNNMRVGATETDFIDVKKAFESTYGCLKIKGSEVGGLWNDAEGEYYKNASPSGVASTSTILAAGAAGIAALAMLL